MDIVVSEHLSRTLPERLAHHKGAVLVADPDTRKAIGETTFIKLCDALNARSVMLPTHPKASIEHADAIAEALQDAPLAVAIGSGTINDLTKYAAHTCGIPYVSIATAPSMNGYSSSTASLIEKGYKHSFNATAPVAIYVDTYVLANAPTRMIAAGVGDTLCRSTVEADWRLAHSKGKAIYDENIMAPLREAETELFTHIDKISKRDTGAIARLWHALLAGGNAMRTHGSSMPASQGEHMIAHAMEAQTGSSGKLHGEEIAVTTLTMARVQEQLLPSLKEDATWIGEHRRSADSLVQALISAGCPVTPETLGWDRLAYSMIVNNTWRTRDRYGFLTLAAEQGITIKV